MDTALFDYDLPPARIAQSPAEPRDSSRLLVLHRADGRIEHRTFRDIVDYLNPRDLLVANNSRVIPARLHGRKATGGAVELFLLRQLDDDGAEWECLVGGKGLGPGATIALGDNLAATITFVGATGTRHVLFSAPVRPYLDELGEMPLPPYITAYTGDPERYQTVYSLPEGSAAAPTAGLHFTPELLLEIRELGVQFETVTLHVGLDTFKPVAERAGRKPRHPQRMGGADGPHGAPDQRDDPGGRSSHRGGYDYGAHARMGGHRHARAGPV